MFRIISSLQTLESKREATKRDVTNKDATKKNAAKKNATKKKCNAHTFWSPPSSAGGHFYN